MPPARAARFLMAAAAAMTLVSGCSMWGRGGGDEKPETTAATTPATSPATIPGTTPAAANGSGEIDVRRYLGPNYCPEIRVLSGAELMRVYERGHDDDAHHIVWQAAFGKTARECLFDQQGGLTIRVGVSGRVIAGPKGASVGAVSVPFKVAVVKYRESVLATEKFDQEIAIPPQGAAVFTKVKDIVVPSPGQDRDYIIYVGFDVGEWDAMNGEAAAVAVVEEEPPPPPPPPTPPPTPAPTTPNVLPTPDDGFVLQ